MEIVSKTVRAPEIYGDFWFNSEPLALQALRGQVVLIDFWDYTCINCLRTIPYLREWQTRYSDKGLVIIGVHTPEFSFAKNPRNVEKAIQRLTIFYPVVTDNEYLIWEAFANRYWPAKYLIDKAGYIRYCHYGEGNYGNTEHTIQALLVEAGYHGELPLVMEPLRETDKPGAVCYRPTPEIYTGYLRGSIGNTEGLNLESTMKYTDPKVYVNGRFYAHGRWFIGREYIRLDETEGNEGYIVLSYQAAKVNAVIKPEGEKGFKVFVMQDEQFLTMENKGDDVQIDSEGKSFLLIHEPRMYNLVNNREFGEHILKMSVASTSFALYAFTFITCVIPEFSPT